MSLLSSIAAKAVLIAVGGVAVTVVATVSIVLLYCCSCRRKNRDPSKERRRQATEANAQSQTSLMATGSEATRSNHSTVWSQTSVDSHHHCSSSEGPPPYISQLTSASLATVESGLSRDEIETQLRVTPGRGADTNELEISQKTWSAYETLPRGITEFFRDGDQQTSDSQQCNTVDSSRHESEFIDTLDNDAYSTSLEMESLARNREHFVSRAQRLRSFPSRVSTISTASSGSGYVINSLNSPGLQSTGRDRSSCYSTGSEGYVISHSEWSTGKPTVPSRLVLPSIAEDSTSQVEYLYIIP